MDELDTAILGLVEAAKRGARKRHADKLLRPLELAMRKAFKAQGALFVKKLRSKFAESDPGPSPHPGLPPNAQENAANLEEGAKWMAWARQLERPFREAIGESDWLLVWLEVAQATAALFADPIDKAVAAALAIGALASIAEIGADIKWDVKNPLAQAYLDNYGADLVTGINETTRNYLNTLMTQAMNEGWSYQKTAEAIVERFEEFGVGKPQEHIDSRAHLIAVTEVGNAYAEGNLQIAKQLQAAGIEMEKYWSTVGDGRVSEECKANEEAGWIPLDEDFPSGDQRPLRFPGCRCDLLTQVKK